MMILKNLFRYFFPISSIFWDKIVHYGPFKFVPLLFTPSRISNDQNVLQDSLNLFRYIWHHLVQSEQNCLWWLFFKSVPLLFTISSMFWDEIVHYGSFKFVPLLFTSSTIFHNKNVHGDSFKCVPLLFILSGIL